MNLQKFLFAWCLCLAFGITAQAAEGQVSSAAENRSPAETSSSQNTPTRAIPLEGVQQIELRGQIGTVRLIGASSPESRLLVRTSGKSGAGNEMNGMRVQRQGGKLILSFVDESSKGGWRQGQVQGDSVTVEMAGVSVPMDVYWHNGSVSATKLAVPLMVNLVSGRVALVANQAEVRVQLQEGDLDIRNHQGRLDLDVYKGTAAIDQVQGRLNLSHFAGTSTIQNIEGDMELFSFSGKTEVSNTAGRIQFDNGRGEMNFKTHSGALHGQSDQGPILSQLSGENVDVDIRTRQASASVVLHRGLAPRVYLRSKEGTVHGPSGLSYKNTALGKVLTGSLGAGDDGRVRVLSDSGTLRLR